MFLRLHVTDAKGLTYMKGVTDKERFEEQCSWKDCLQTCVLNGSVKSHPFSGRLTLSKLEPGRF